MTGYARNENESAAGCPLILSVDGGGTSTTACVYGAADEPLLTLRVRPLSVKSTNVDAVRGVLDDFVCALRAEGFGPDDFALSVWGLSGLDTTRTLVVYQNLLDAAGIPRDRRLVVNDAVLPLFAAGYGSGIVLVAGTGSIALSVDREGAVGRAGGWGYASSDAGSGYWIGREALAYALRCADRIAWDDGLAGAVAIALCGRPFVDVLKQQAADGVINPVDVASLARIALDACSSASAQKIASEAAEHLADLVYACDGATERAGFAKTYDAARLVTSYVRSLSAADILGTLVEFDAGDKAKGGTGIRLIRLSGTGASDCGKLVCDAQDGGRDVPVVLSGGLFASKAFADEVEKRIMARWSDEFAFRDGNVLYSSKPKPRVVRVRRAPVWGGAVLGRLVLSGRSPYTRWLGGTEPLGWIC